MTYYIFRHGETKSTKEGNSGYGDAQFTATILPEGMEAIEKMARYLQNIDTDHNVASELLRVQQTVEIISKITGKSFVKDKRLNELLDENGKEPPYPFTGYFKDHNDKVRSFIDEMDSMGHKSVLVGTHGYVIAALKNLLTTGVFHVENISDFPRPGVLTIVKGKDIEEINFN